MAKWVSEFTVPADDRDGLCGIKFEDGGQAAIMYDPADDPVTEGGDGHFFVRLHSWQDEARKGDGTTHRTFRSLMGKRVRVTIEEVE